MVSERSNSPSIVELETTLAHLEQQINSSTIALEKATEKVRLVERDNCEFFTQLHREISLPMKDIADTARLMLSSKLNTGQKATAQDIEQSGQRLLESIKAAKRVMKNPEAEFTKQLGSKNGNTSSFIDEDYVRKLKADFNPDPFRSLLQYFFNDVEQAIEDLENAVNRNDTSEIQNLLHLLKGCSANFGARTIVAFCIDHKEGLNRPEGMTEAQIMQLKQIYESCKDQLLQAAM